MAVPSGIIFFWPSTAASIPTGYARNTDLDARYLMGNTASVDPGGTGGSSTHSHTATDHNHTATTTAHDHTVSAAAGSGYVVNGTGSGTVVPENHTHGNSDSATATITTQDSSVTMATATNDQAYLDVIGIESAGTHDIPDGALAFFDDSTPAGWDAFAAAVDRWLRGAATSGDGGGTGGTLGSHTHTTTAHGHIQDAHGHAAANSASQSSTTTQRADPGSTMAEAHTHRVSLASTTATTQNATATMQNSDGRPPFTTLVCAENTSGSGSLPEGVIGVWLDSLASIPADWYLCDGSGGTIDTRDKFVQCTDDDGEVGTTGGSSQHTHTADGHTHTFDNHTHTASVAALTSTKGENGTSRTPSSTSHTHSWTVSSEGGTSGSTTITIANCSAAAAYPAYRKVAFIKYIPPGGAAYSSVISVAIN